MTFLDTPSRDLYALAGHFDSRARGLDHKPDVERPDRCATSCLRCLFEAKARLHGRAGDAAKACADGRPVP